MEDELIIVVDVEEAQETQEAMKLVGYTEPHIPNEGFKTERNYLEGMHRAVL